MGVRADRKQQTRRAILDGAGRLLRERGLAGAGVATIMNEAGLTHGGFYSHFESRRQLVAEVLSEASMRGRRWYLRGIAGRTGRDWVRAAVGRYLTARHRDTPQSGCVVAGLGGDLAREDEALRGVFENELAELVGEFSAHLEDEDDPDADDRALALVALCSGGITLSRAVADRRFSNRILRACQRLAARDLEE